MGIKGIQSFNKRDERLNEERLNNQGCLMRIIEYDNSSSIIVEFQDEYKTKIHAAYSDFKKGLVKNPYYPTVYGVGMIGVKYQSKIGKKNTKEYNTWLNVLKRCFDTKEKERNPTYQNVTCCEEWLLYENFYEWLHNQSNFDKWYNGARWHIDKDIVIKGNRIYSPNTCCLVPYIVNGLFAKSDAIRGCLPIGVSKFRDGYQAQCKNPLINGTKHLGLYSTPTQAFQAYKIYKEKVIKQVAKSEYKIGNITTKCYESMMLYIVEIDD